MRGRQWFASIRWRRMVRVVNEVAMQLCLAWAGFLAGLILAHGYSWGDAERDKALLAMGLWACLWVCVGGFFADRSLRAKWRVFEAEQENEDLRRRICELEPQQDGNRRKTMSEDKVNRRMGIYAWGTWVRSERADDDLKVEDVRTGDVIRDGIGAAVVVDMAFVEGSVHLRLEDLPEEGDPALAYHADALAMAFMAHLSQVRAGGGVPMTGAEGADVRSAMRRLLLEQVAHGLVSVVCAEESETQTAVCSASLGSGGMHAQIALAKALGEVAKCVRVRILASMGEEEVEGEADRDMRDAIASAIASLTGSMPKA